MNGMAIMNTPMQIAHPKLFGRKNNLGTRW
jgi:hypothetical protein